jgi:BioD-like phosphotransacetylase family protein
MSEPAPQTAVVPVLLKNRVTPRIFVAATRQDDGKTTTSVGLFAALQKRLPNIGYIKPVGQRFVEVEGLKIDEDSVLINDTYRVRTPLRAMSPIAVEPDFTRRYLSGGNTKQLHDEVQRAFDEASWEKDFVIIEGTGHAGVGSVFDLSNAQVAKLLNSQVIIVSQGGIGKPIDEISLNLALFEKYGVEVIGAIINKVTPDKIDQIRTYAERGLARMGLPLLGVIPLSHELRRPTINQVALQLKGEFLSGAEHKRRRVSRVIIGAMSSKNAESFFEAGTLIITPGDREDIILAAVGWNQTHTQAVTGLVLTGGLVPQDGVMAMVREKGLPVVSCKADSYSAASAINKMTVKTEVGDRDKIALIQKLIDENVNVNAILSAAQSKCAQDELPLRNV